MAIRATADNLSLDLPSQAGTAGVRDFTEVWAHREALRQACVRMIGDPARAEDLVQDTFVSALKCSGRLHEDQPVAPWLKTVARRRSIDELRGRDRVSLMATLPEAATPSGDDPAEHVVSQELVGALRSAIADLTPRERQLLLRQASYGLSLAELAAEEHTSIASVRSVLARARQKLRGSLERGGVFGVLPLPRYLATLRERIGRWGMQLEPTLPAVTGASARMGEAVVAMVTAIAMLLAGGLSAPSYPDSSLVTTGLASSSFGLAPAGSGTNVPGARLGGGGSGGGGGGPSGSTTPTSVPSGPPIGSLPPTLGDQKLPPDGSEDMSASGIVHFTSSSDGQVVLASGISNLAVRPVLYRSDDGGESWRRMFDQSVDELEQSRTFPGGELFVGPEFPQDNTVYALSNGSLFRSTDGGATFGLAAPSIGKAVPSPSFGSNDRRFFVSGPPPGVYDDSDGEFHGIVGVPPSISPGHDITIGPDFDTTGEFLITSLSGTVTARHGAIHTCTSSGCTLRSTVPTRNAPQVHTSSSNPSTVFAWQNDYFGRSTDGGYSFVDIGVPAEFSIQGFFDAGDTLYRYGLNSFAVAAPIYRSDDDGATWEPVGVGTPISRGVASLIALPNGRLIAGSAYNDLYCSVDDGVTWTPRCTPS